MNSELASQIRALIGTGPGSDRNNRYEQIYRSLLGPHVTPHDWLRYYLNYVADGLDPNRHWYLHPERMPIPENQKTRAGLLPMISPAYILLLQEHNVMPVIPPGASSDEAFSLIENSLQQVFNNKMVYFVPGRAGFEAKFVSKFGANTTVTTVEPYIQLAESCMADISTSAHLINAKLEEVLPSVAPLRLDMHDAWPHAKHLDTSTDVFKNSYALSPPNILFCSNVMNTHRFNLSDSPHHIQLNWNVLMKRILALGTTDTKFYFTPAFDYQPEFTKDELLNEIGDFANVSFYDQSAGYGESIVRSAGDFAFSVQLQKPVPLTGLELY